MTNLNDPDTMLRYTVLSLAVGALLLLAIMASILL